MQRIVLLTILGLVPNFPTLAETLPKPKPDLIVAADGSGQFKTIQAALDAVPGTNTERKVVFIKNGTYREKIRVDASCVTLLGQSRNGTRIEYPQDNVAFNKNPDAIGRAVVNVNEANDFVVENLTIENSAGVIGPHAFAIYSTGDRGVVADCNVLSHGADTVSYWGKDNRSYYANSRIEGSVDFVCPRGWCHATNCSLYEMKNTAAVWHDGSRNRRMKFVLRDCQFDGAKGWNLARHHLDAQFYFLDCRFSRTMIDRAPFRVIYPLNGGKPSPSDMARNKELDKVNNWGERSYFYNCHRTGGDYPWFADNLAEAPGAPKPDQINAAWTFDGTWNPESTTGPVIKKINRHDGQIAVVLSENVTVRGNPRLKLSSGHFAGYLSGSGSETLKFQSPDKSAKAVSMDLNGSFIFASQASVAMRMAELALPRSLGNANLN